MRLHIATCPTKEAQGESGSGLDSCLQCTARGGAWADFLKGRERIVKVSSVLMWVVFVVFFLGEWPG